MKKRLTALNRVIEIQSNIIVGVLELDSQNVLKVVKRYTLALKLLDSYDSQTISEAKLTTNEIYKLTYEEYTNLISKMSYSETFAIFG